MNTLDLLRRCYIHGADIHLEGDGIRLSGQTVPDDLLAELKINKAGIIALMKEQGIGTNDDGYLSGAPRRYVVPGACLGQRTCTRLGPCSRFLMRGPCTPVEQAATELEEAS